MLLEKGKFFSLFFIVLTLSTVFCDNEDSFGTNDIEIRNAELIDQSVQTLPLLSPIGQASGIAIDPITNNLVIFHRSGRVWNTDSFNSKNQFNRKLGPISNATIAILNSETGAVISEHGKSMFYMPHGLNIDADGNYWLTDVGSHQVYKLDKNFRPQMILGEKMVPGSDDRHFCKPTDVAVATTGDFFVADGYCNGRIIQFDKNGKVLAKFGREAKNTPMDGGFVVPHSLALIEDLEILCVADRDNERIQCFSVDLQHANKNETKKFYIKAEGIGPVYAIREKEHYVVGVTNFSAELEPKVFMVDILTGNAKILAKGLDNSHAIAIDDKGDIFVSQMEPNRIIKFGFPSNAP